MCRNIRTLYNFEPPATEDEIRAAAVQYVRKISGFHTPSQANEGPFNRAVEQVSACSRELLEALVTQAPAKDRKAEAAKAKARAAKRFGTALVALMLGAPTIGACDASSETAVTPPEVATSGSDSASSTDSGSGPSSEPGAGSSTQQAQGSVQGSPSAPIYGPAINPTTDSPNAPPPNAPPPAATTAPDDTGSTNVELEVDTSAVGTCGGRIVLGVGNTVREVRPENPFIIQAVELRINADIAVAHIAAFACGGDFLYALVNVGDPEDPDSWLPAIASIRLQSSGGFGSWKLTGLPRTSSLTYAGDIEAAGGRLWVTTYDPGYFRVFDLQTPDTPREIGSLDLPASFVSGTSKPNLSVGDGYAFIAADTSVLVIDLFEPDAPALVGHVDAPGDPMGELAEISLAYADDVSAEGKSALAVGPDGVWSVIRDDATGEWGVGGVISFGMGERRFIGRHDGHPGIERTMPSDTGEVWASVYEEVDMRLPAAPVVAAAASLPNGYARRLVLIADRLFAVRHDGSVEMVATEKLGVFDPHVR